MRIRLRYKEEDGHKFPIINVILKADDRSTPPVEALLDSGASRTSFDVGLARILQLPLEKEEKREILTAAGPAVEHFYTHKVSLNFVDSPLPRDVPIEIDFISKLYPKDHPRIILETSPFGILGHHDFFRTWKITFDTRRGEVVLESYQ